MHEGVEPIFDFLFDNLPYGFLIVLVFLFRRVEHVSSGYVSHNLALNKDKVKVQSISRGIDLIMRVCVCVDILNISLSLFSLSLSLCVFLKVLFETYFDVLIDHCPFI